MSLKECAIDIDFRDLVELQCTRKPHPAVAACIGYLCVLLGQKPTWETAKKTLFTGLIPLHKFLFEVNPEAISVRRLKSAIYHRATALQGETVHSLAMVSIPAGKLMKWIYAMHFIGLLLVTGYELRGDGEEGRRMSFFSDLDPHLDPFASSDSEIESKNLLLDPTQRKHQHQHREVGGSHYQPHRLKRLGTSDSNSSNSGTGSSPKQSQSNRKSNRPLSDDNDESERIQIHEWTIGNDPFPHTQKYLPTTKSSQLNSHTCLQEKKRKVWLVQRGRPKEMEGETLSPWKGVNTVMLSEQEGDNNQVQKQPVVVSKKRRTKRRGNWHHYWGMNLPFLPPTNNNKKKNSVRTRFIENNLNFYISV